MGPGSIEISVKGKWVSVPSLDFDGKTVIVRGKWIKVAQIHDEWWMESELEAPETFVQKLKEQSSNGLRADIFTFSQKLPGSLPKYNYAKQLESVAAARTLRFQEWWNGLPQESRKNVRRSQKRGVVVTVRVFDDDLVKGIIGVNNDTPTRQGRPNVYYGQSFDQAKRDHSAFLNRCDFICAHSDNELIGFLKLVYKGEVAAILNLAVKASQNDKRPANALIAKAVELCEKRGVSYLTYGMFNYGNKQESLLREFKSRNRFEEVLTPRYYVPLTRWGKLVMRLGFHRGLLGILPHNVIALGLNARTRWYKFKNFLSRCSSMLEQPNRIRQTERSNPPAGSRL
jgi:GNAT acetyltransferase-like protein